MLFWCCCVTCSGVRTYTVLDLCTGDPISGAAVTVSPPTGPDIYGSTDGSGECVISIPMTGAYTAAIVKTGYLDEADSFTVTDCDANSEVTIEMGVSCGCDTPDPCTLYLHRYGNGTGVLAEYTLNYGPMIAHSTVSSTGLTLPSTGSQVWITDAILGAGSRTYYILACDGSGGFHLWVYSDFDAGGNVSFQLDETGTDTNECDPVYWDHTPSGPPSWTNPDYIVDTVAP